MATIIGISFLIALAASAIAGAVMFAAAAKRGVIVTAAALGERLERPFDPAAVEAEDLGRPRARFG